MTFVAKTWLIRELEKAKQVINEKANTKTERMWGYKIQSLITDIENNLDEKENRALPYSRIENEFGKD
jgi:hypothetical protein